jgi:hypothetical protein
MITECFNPVCKRELVYLPEGRVVRLIKTQRGQMRVEHFWLCGDCYQRHDFRFCSRGDVGLILRDLRPKEVDVRKHQILVSAEIRQEETGA